MTAALRASEKTLNQRTDLILQALQEDQQAALLEVITQVNNTPTRQKLYSLLDDLVKQETLINDKAEELKGLRDPDSVKASEVAEGGAGAAGDRADDPEFRQQGFWTTVNKVRDDMDIERRRMELAMLKNQREGGSVGSYLGTYDKEIEQLDALRTHSKASAKDIADLDSEILNLKIQREKKAAENAASGRRDRIRDFNREVDLRSKYLRDQGFLELSSNRRSLEAMRERAEAMESIQMGSIQKIQDALKKIDQEQERRHDTDVQDYAKRITDDVKAMRKGIEDLGFSDLGDVRSDLTGFRDEIDNQGILDNYHDLRGNVTDEIATMIEAVDKQVIDMLRSEMTSALDSGLSLDFVMGMYEDVIATLGDSFTPLADELQQQAIDISTKKAEDKAKEIGKAVKNLDDGVEDMTIGQLEMARRLFDGYRESMERLGMTFEEFMGEHQSVLSAIEAQLSEKRDEIRKLDLVIGFRQRAAEGGYGAAPDMGPTPVSATGRPGIGRVGYADSRRAEGVGDFLDVLSERFGAVDKMFSGRSSQFVGKTAGVLDQFNIRGGLNKIGGFGAGDLRGMLGEFGVDGSQFSNEQLQRRLDRTGESLSETELKGILKDLGVAAKDLRNVDLSNRLDGFIGIFDRMAGSFSSFIDNLNKAASVTNLFGDIAEESGTKFTKNLHGVASVLSGLPAALASGQGLGGGLASIAGGVGGFLLGGPTGAALGSSLGSTLYGLFSKKDELEDGVGGSSDASGRSGRDRLQVRNTTVHIGRIINEVTATVEQDVDIVRLADEVGLLLERRMREVTI